MQVRRVRANIGSMRVAAAVGSKLNMICKTTSFCDGSGKPATASVKLRRSLTLCNSPSPVLILSWTKTRSAIITAKKSVKRKPITRLNSTGRLRVSCKGNFCCTRRLLVALWWLFDKPLSCSGTCSIRGIAHLSFVLRANRYGCIAVKSAEALAAS